MWLPLTITAGTPAASACDASAGVGNTPHQSTRSPARAIASAHAAAMRGLLGRRSIPSATVSKRNDSRITATKAWTYAAQTSSVKAVTSPRAPLVPNTTPLSFIARVIRP